MLQEWTASAVVMPSPALAFARPLESAVRVGGFTAQAPLEPSSCHARAAVHVQAIDGRLCRCSFRENASDELQVQTRWSPDVARRGTVDSTDSAEVTDSLARSLGGMPIVD